MYRGNRCDRPKTSKSPNAWTKDEMMKMAKDVGIRGRWLMTKDELCRALRLKQKGRAIPKPKRSKKRGPRSRARENVKRRAKRRSQSRSRKLKKAQRSKLSKIIERVMNEDEEPQRREQRRSQKQSRQENLSLDTQQLSIQLDAPIPLSVDADSMMFPTKVTLKQHQEMIVRHMLKPNVKGIIVRHSLGSGKTISAISAAEALMKIHKDWKALFIVSASLVDNVKKELKKMKVSSRRYTIMSRDKFLRIRNPDCSKRILIVDEAHNLKNMQGKMYAAVAHCASSAPKVILLTGTPIQNYPSEISALINMVSTGDAFVSPGAFELQHGQDGLSHPNALFRKLKCKISMYDTPTNSTDFPSLAFKDVLITMTPEYCKEYENRENLKLTDRFRQEMIAHGGDVTEPSKSLKVFLNGPRRWCNHLGDESPKIDELVMNVLHTVERGDKALVYSQFLGSGLNIIAQKLAQLNVPFAMFTGEVSMSQKRKVVKQYNRGVLPVLLLSKAGGEGLDLKNTDEVHLLEPYWNDAVMAQVIGRARRYKSHQDHRNPGPHTVTVYRYFLQKCDDADNETSSADMYLKEMAERKDETLREFTLERLRPASIEVARC